TWSNIQVVLHRWFDVGQKCDFLWRRDLLGCQFQSHFKEILAKMSSRNSITNGMVKNNQNIKLLITFLFLVRKNEKSPKELLSILHKGNSVLLDHVLLPLVFISSINHENAISHLSFPILHF